MRGGYFEKRFMSRSVSTYDTAMFGAVGKIGRVTHGTKNHRVTNRMLVTSARRSLGI